MKSESTFIPWPVAKTAIGLLTATAFSAILLLTHASAQEPTAAKGSGHPQAEATPSGTTNDKVRVTAEETFVKTHGQLAVQGTRLVDAHGEPIVLRGVSYGWHTWWHRFYNTESVDWLAKDWKCTVVRAAMGVEPRGSYLDKPDWSRKLMKTVVDAAIARGIYVIIDWHDHHAHQHTDEAITFFTEMATLYGDQPNVIYEIYNEPVRVSWPEVKRYSRKVIDAIRAIDPDNIILVGSPHWDQDVHIVADDPMTGVKNIMYTLHFYADTHKQSLRDRGDYALSKGLPLFVSEYGGCSAAGNGRLNKEEWNAWIEWTEQRKISWVKWSISSKDETCSMLPAEAADTGHWPADTLTPSGAYTRELLRRLNGSKSATRSDVPPVQEKSPKIKP
jgi:endoglucanase